MKPTETAPTRKTSFPGLRCVMGKWVYYVTSMTFADVAQWVERSDEIYESEQLRDLVQREISDRVGGIVGYLRSQPERFFGAIIVGLYEGSPDWYSVEVGPSLKGEAPDPSDGAFSNLGVLALEGHERVFAIDGQHRVEGIKRAIEADPKLAEDDLAVIFVAHGTTKRDKERTRRLFTTLNKNAKPVTPGEIVALDEDDAFAVVARRLVEEFEPLRSGFKDRSGFVLITGKAQLPASDNNHLTTILALYEIARLLHVPLGTEKRAHVVRNLTYSRPNDARLKAIYDQQVAYWNALKRHVPAYKSMFSQPPETGVAGRLRRDDRQLMMRPIAQMGFARAVSVLVGRGTDMREAVKLLSRIPMRLDEAPWDGTLWDAGRQRLKRSPGLPFVESLMLHLVGQVGLNALGAPSALLKRYRELTNDPSAQLPPPLV